MTNQSGDGVKFDIDSAAKIARVVRSALEQQGGRDSRPPPAKQLEGAGFYAQITGINGTGHSWKRMDLINGTLAVSSPVVQDTNFSAIEINSQVANVGENVFLKQSGYNTSNNSTYIFTNRAPYDLFVVALNQSGGSQGSAGSACTYTYDVYPISTGTSGPKIGSALAVEKPRLIATVTSAATKGVAYMDAASPPVLHLWDVGESFNVNTC